MQTQLAPWLHLGWRRPAATPPEAQAPVALDEPQMRRALPILAAGFAFYAIAVIGCLYADRQHAAQQAATATAAAKTVGAR